MPLVKRDEAVDVRGGGGRWARLRSTRRPQRYAERTPALGRAVRRRPALAARAATPASTLYHPPHPLYLDHGAGSRVWDVDGHELVDLTNNHTALVHGNANPVVADAVRAQLDRGSCFSGPDARCRSRWPTG